MALSIKINNDDNNDKNKNQNQQNPLSTKLNQTDNRQEQNVISTNSNQTAENHENTNYEANNKQDSEKVVIPANKQEFLDFWLEKLGSDNFGKIDKEKYDKIFAVEPPMNNQQIFQLLLNDLISQELVDKINTSIFEKNSENEQLKSQINILNEKHAKFQQQIENLTLQIQDAEERIFKTEKKYVSTIAIADIIHEMLTRWLPVRFAQSVEDLLTESYNSVDKQNKEFVISFIRGAQFFISAIDKITDDEKENLTRLYDATTQMFKVIQGKFATERRPLLDKIAAICNNYLKDYDFISPEQSLQIDTHLHNAEGKGGTMVKEGLSMAVVRRDTRKTVYYADITTK